jgi:RNA exonuclease 1
MPICRFHQGKLKENVSLGIAMHNSAQGSPLTTQKWTCCHQKPGNKGCVGYLQHTPRACPTAELLEKWQFFKTPSQDGKWYLPAVAIDCEMGINHDGTSELIRVSVVDYLTSDILLDRLVFPKNLKHPNKKYSGVEWRDLHTARMQGNCFAHRRDALRAVWEFVGPETVVVGHSVNSDLMALRWIHQNIVDTLVLEKEEHVLQTKACLAKSEGICIPMCCPLPEEPKRLDIEEPTAEGEPKKKKEKGSGIFSLQSVIQARLGRSIRRNNKHDSVEDAVAARDIAEWHANNRSKAH